MMIFLMCAKIYKLGLKVGTIAHRHVLGMPAIRQILAIGPV